MEAIVIALLSTTHILCARAPPTARILCVTGYWEPRSAAVAMADKPPWWDALLYGQRGRPSPPTSPPPPISSLRALFSQLDTNDDGVLQRDELLRVRCASQGIPCLDLTCHTVSCRAQALVLLDIPQTDHEIVFDALCSSDESCFTDINYDEFEERLPADTRAALEAKLTAEGVLPSLYVPPEQVQAKCASLDLAHLDLRDARPSHFAAQWTETRSADELRWEQQVQLEARRGGNQLKQNDILQNEIGRNQ